MKAATPYLRVVSATGLADGWQRSKLPSRASSRHFRDLDARRRVKGRVNDAFEPDLQSPRPVTGWGPAIRAGTRPLAPAGQVAQVDPAVVAVDVEAVAPQEADERHAEPLGGLDRQVRWGRHRRRIGTPAIAAFWTISKLTRPRHDEDPVVERQRARQQLAPTSLSSALCRPTSSRTSTSSPSRREQRRPRAGRRCVEGELGRAQRSGSARSTDRATTAGPAAAGRSGRRSRRSTPCRRCRNSPSPRNGARRRPTRRRQRLSRTMTVSSGWASAGRVADLDAVDLVVARSGPRSAGSPTASSASEPGVRIVTATGTGAWPGPRPGSPSALRRRACRRGPPGCRRARATTGAS